MTGRKVPFDEIHVRKIPDNEGGTWLRTFPLSHYGKFSFKDRVDETEAKRRFELWVGRMCATEGQPVAYFLEVERKYPRANPHLHCLLIGTESFKMYKWQQEWWVMAGWSKITPYDPKGRICEYLGAKFESPLAQEVYSPGFPSTMMPDPSPPMPVAEKITIVHGTAIPSHDRDVALPYVGTADYGRSNYFGSVAVAGVLVGVHQVDELRALGLCASVVPSALPETECGNLATRIRRICYSNKVREFKPEQYNEDANKVSSGGWNLSQKVGWAHGEVIASVAGFPCLRAVQDQFADSKSINKFLVWRGRQVEVRQTSQADSYVGVAAATILARDRALFRLKKLSKVYGVSLPEGKATPEVIKAGKDIVAQRGEGALSQVSKLHFNTTTMIVGHQDADDSQPDPNDDILSFV